MRYSCLMFQVDITKNTLNEITSLLKDGVKVCFFTYDPVDDLLEDELVKQAVKEQFLFVYEMIYNNDLVDDFIYFDGKVPRAKLDILRQCTPEVPFNTQQFLAEHSEENESILVSAGAGTGKTTLMINRIIFLKYMNPDMNFSQIGLITFTNKAAHNLREKLVEKIKKYFYFTNDFKYFNWLKEFNEMTIGTIHTFGFKMLQDNRAKLYNRTNLTISSFSYDRRKIIEEVIDDYREEYPEGFKKIKYIQQYKIVEAVQAIINQINNNSLSYGKVKELDFGESTDGSHELYKYLVLETMHRLEMYKMENEYIDVNDLIQKLDDIITGEQAFNIPYTYIFIDEFQDTDRQQTQFFAHLANKYGVKLFVVGDVKQSIYRFRGADYTAFKQLNKQMKIDKSYYLQLNYRTHKKLLDEFNNLFSTWPGKVKSFSYEKNDYLLPGLDYKATDEEKIVNVGNEDIDFLKSIENTDTAILLRSNREVNEYSRLCEHNKIFYSAEKDGDFYRSLPVREFYQLILRFTNPQLWSNRYLLHGSSYGDNTYLDANVINKFNVNRLVDQSMRELDKKLEEYEDRFREESVFEVISSIIETIEPARVYTERFMEQRKSTSVDKKTKVNADLLYQEYNLNLDFLLYQLKLELESTIPTLNNIEKILKIKMSTDTTTSRIKLASENNGRLTIMTVHKAKGLEFDNVYLPNLKTQFNKFSKYNVLINDDQLGYRTFIEDGRTFTNNFYEDFIVNSKAEDIGEEARLLYVALTRAKEQVYINATHNSNSHTVKSWRDLVVNTREDESKKRVYI